MKEYKLKINGNDYNVVIEDVEDSSASVEVNGTPYTVSFEKPITKAAAVKIVRPNTPQAVTPAQGRESASTNTAPTSGTTIFSPLPGIIFELNVKEGDSVKAGQTILVLEAMKMENAIESPEDGIVKSIKINKGDSVLEGAPLVVIG